MLKIVLSFFFVTAGINLLGQLTIPTSHMPRIGDVFTFASNNGLYTPKAFSGGVYDFSDLKQDDTAVFRYLANDKTVEFPKANLKIVEDDNDNSTIYFNKSGNDLFVISLAAVQQQLPIPIGSLIGTMKYLSLPITSSTNINSTDAISAVIPPSLLQGFNIDSLASTIIPGAKVDSIKITINFKLNLYADGSGKIKTPTDNNIDVIKVVRKISFTPKIGLYGKAFGIPVKDLDITSFIAGQLPLDNLNLTTHTFYSPSIRQEIVLAIVDTSGNYNTVNYRFRTKDGPNTAHIQSSSIEKLELLVSGKNVEVKNLLPNQKADLIVYRLDGRKVIEKKVSYSDASLLIDNITSPLILVLSTESGVISKKIILE